MTVREINALAGQRNPSALHYHFGSRDGLVQAILGAHQAAMDDELRRRLDELESRDAVTIRDVVEAAVRPLARKLESESGRDFLRILPQVLDVVSDHLRRGATLGGSDQPSRTLTLLDGCIAELPRAVRQERLVAYSLTLTSLFAERALLVESGDPPGLEHEQFVHHVLDVVGAVVGAPSTVKARRTRRAT